MRHAVSKELYAYWNALRAGRGAPERNDVDPGAIRAILADTFVLEFDARHGFPFRIGGSRVNALFLRELRGVSFLRLWREPDWPEIKSVLRDVADQSQPSLLCGEARPPGVGALEIEVMLLPLCHHGSTHSRVLGSLVAAGAPHWFGLIGAGAATLTSATTLGGQIPPPPTAEPQRGSASASAPERRGPLLVYSRENRST